MKSRAPVSRDILRVAAFAAFPAGVLLSCVETPSISTRGAPTPHALVVSASARVASSPGAIGSAPMASPAPPASDGVATSTETAPAKRPLRPFRPRLPVNSFPTRAATEQATSIDFDAIPTATAVALGVESSTFKLTALDLTPKNCPPHRRAHVRMTHSLALYASQPMLVQVGSVLLPNARFLDGLHETPVLDRLPDTGRVPATWLSLLRGTGEDAVDVTEFDGAYDAASSVGAADTKVQAHVPTLLPDSGIYAFRRCVKRCDGPAADRNEELTLIGPPAIWVGSSEASVDHSTDRRTPFTRITVPLRRGSSATLEIVAFDDDIVRFKKGLPPFMFGQVKKQDRWTTLSLEVVWQGESSSPDVDLYVGHASGETSTLRSDIDVLFVPLGLSFESGCRPDETFNVQ